MKLNATALTIIRYLLRGYRKGFGVDLNMLEPSGPDEQDELPEWLEAIKQLAEISASTEAKYDIERLEKILATREKPQD